MTGPKVINRHHYMPEPGFGPPRPQPTRALPRLPSPRLYIGRGSPLGNPFVVPEHGTIEQVLARYRRMLWDRIRANDFEILTELTTITEAHHLVCSCAPRPCHGDIVVAAWRWCLDHGMLVPRQPP